MQLLPLTLSLSPLSRIHLYTVVIKATIVENPSHVKYLGQKFTLICQLTGINQLSSIIQSDITFQWLKDGGLLPNEMNSKLKFDTLHHEDSGEYQCQVVVKSSALNRIFNSDLYILSIPGNILLNSCLCTD